jgi:hypothetical protein
MNIDLQILIIVYILSLVAGLLRIRYLGERARMVQEYLDNVECIECLRTDAQTQLSSSRIRWLEVYRPEDWKGLRRFTGMTFRKWRNFCKEYANCGSCHHSIRLVDCLDTDLATKALVTQRARALALAQYGRLEAEFLAHEAELSESVVEATHDLVGEAL